MLKDLIGVIVPVYKTEEYIVECIESILAQTHTNFRLILVDDGSPDNAGAICDEYAAKDKRITVIHQENAGVTRARARGVEEASDCEWITFVDSDDTITKDALESLLTSFDNNTEIILCDSNKKDTKPLYASYIDIVNYRKLIISNKFCEPWGKLFKTTLFNDFVFKIPKDIIIAEDLLMNLRLAFNTNKKVTITHKQTYNYRERTDSTFHSFIRTHQNEQDIHQQKLQSIPSEQLSEYIKSTINIRILFFNEFWGYKYNVDDMEDSLFYIELRNDIEKLNYKLPFIERVIFFCTNPIMRYFAINTKKILNIINTHR